MIVENKLLHNKYRIFESREKAGKQLVELIENECFDVIVIIPNGGMPVGLGLLKNLSREILAIDLLIVKKIHVPWTTEAGMGAITPDGKIFLNDRITSQLSIDDLQLQKQIDLARERIVKIKEKFDLKPFNDYIDKDVLIVDDGIASGFSMIAGANWLKTKGVRKILIGSPTAPLSSLKILEKYVDTIFCLNIREGYSFAVADAYKKWYDLTNEEAKKYLEMIQNYV